MAQPPSGQPPMQAPPGAKPPMFFQVPANMRPPTVQPPAGMQGPPSGPPGMMRPPPTGPPTSMPPSGGPPGYPPAATTIRPPIPTGPPVSAMTSAPPPAFQPPPSGGYTTAPIMNVAPPPSVPPPPTTAIPDTGFSSGLLVSVDKADGRRTAGRRVYPPGSIPATSPGTAMPPTAGGQPQPQAGQPGHTGAITQPSAPKRDGSVPQAAPSSEEAEEAPLKVFVTRSRLMPPPPSSNYIAQDDGNCTPRFMRLTVNNVAVTGDMVANAGIPIAAIIQPLADTAPGEAPVPVVDFGAAGPIRCARCGGYVNPLVKWLDGQRRWVCNICDSPNEVSGDFANPVDSYGRRREIGDRHELSRGSVEFAAPKEFWTHGEPQPLATLFVIDVSAQAIQSGLIHVVTHSLLNLLDNLPGGPKARLGVITFDSTVQFWNIKPNASQPAMLVVPDVDDVFVPLPGASLVSVAECKESIQKLLQQLPTIVSAARSTEAALGAALKAAWLVCEKRGGHVIAFQSTLPTVGQGKLERREDPKFYGTDKESQLLQPANNEFWSELSKKCQESQVCVDLFACPTGYVDCATMGQVCRMTGGQLYYFGDFHATKEAERFQRAIEYTTTRNMGYDCILRVRCSRGLTVSGQLGDFKPVGPNENIELAGCTSDTTFAVQFKHEDKLDETREAVFQCAMLYTTASGERRIRVHTMGVPVTAMMGNLFRLADSDALLAFFVRNGIDKSRQHSLGAIRESIYQHCVSILYAYRKFCATSTQPGQLILPESLKLLPQYTLGVTKSNAFRQCTPGEIRADERVAQLSLLFKLPLAQAATYAYPRMFAAHKLSGKSGAISPHGEVILPPQVPLSAEKMEPSGIFLLVCCFSFALFSVLELTHFLCSYRMKDSS
eukprot:TRINITY_DN1731_c0_g1_i1.p1 TRINITY_DN1731_c0_g1~~TRINITY_DN1731_c0_g1_i1.p1  ORF type:complete len:899 (-),score=217.06 TRINITY_DN1731_c0_g1_i1:346-3012(-)